MKELGIILDFKEQVITVDCDTLPMRDTTKSAIAKKKGLISTTLPVVGTHLEGNSMRSPHSRCKL